MKTICRVLFISYSSLMLAYPPTLLAQWDKKPYTEWSEKEAMKLLNDSPWAQTQAFTDTSRQASTTRSGAGSTTAIADIVNVNFRIRFLSAKPTRQAVVRAMELQQKGNISEQLAAKLKDFASADFPDYIVLTVSADSDKPSNLLQQANAILYKLSITELKNTTYLVIRDGKRLFLKEYQPPGKDGLGARFIFPRVVDGQPFITAESGDVLFHADLSGGSGLNSTIPNSDAPNRDTSTSPGRVASPLAIGFTLNTRYRVKDMMFSGKLEY